MNNHERAKKAGKSLDLRTFIAGRNRLENPGATALAKAFSVGSNVQFDRTDINYTSLSMID